MSTGAEQPAAPAGGAAAGGPNDKKAHYARIGFKCMHFLLCFFMAFTARATRATYARAGGVVARA